MRRHHLALMMIAVLFALGAPACGVQGRTVGTIAPEVTAEQVTEVPREEPTPIPSSPTAQPPATATPIPPTITAALPTATLMPTTTLPATEEGFIPTSISQVPRINPQELKERLDAGEDVIVVDARKLEFYERYHIAGALSIPLSEIEDRHGELPKENKIVFY